MAIVASLSVRKKLCLAKVKLKIKCKAASTQFTAKKNKDLNMTLGGWKTSSPRTTIYADYNSVTKKGGAEGPTTQSEDHLGLKEIQNGSYTFLGNCPPTPPLSQH